MVKMGDAEALVFLNDIDNSLIFYDYGSGTVSSKIHFPKTGPDGLGEIESFKIINSDSILIVSEAVHAGFFDWKGRLLNKFAKVDYNIRLTPITTSGNPPVLHRGAFYQSGFFMGSRDHEMVLTSSLEKDSCYTMYQIPEIYREAYWGPGEYDMHFHCYNEQEGLFVYSFPPSSSVFVTNHENRKEEYYGGSKYFGEISPISKSPMKSFEKVMDLTLLRPIYQEIMYDPYNEFYYRIAEHPLTEVEIQQINGPYGPEVRDFSIIVLDKNFNKVGESEIIEKGLYDTRIFFVSEQGLHLKKIDIDSEDVMRFGVFNTTNLDSQ